MLLRASCTGRQMEPEVYPRPDGTVYVCGEPQNIPVPPTPAQVSVEPGLCDNIHRVASSIASSLNEVGRGQGGDRMMHTT